MRATISTTLGGAALIAALNGCGPDDFEPDAASDGGGLADVETRTDATAFDAAPDVPSDGGAGRCSSATPLGCAYRSRESGTAAPPVFVSLSYEDASGQTRTFEVALRMPTGAPRPVPVVVWSHGGANGVGSARGVGTEWAEVFVRAGYAFVGIAHPPRDDASRAALCATLGFDTAGCATFKWLSWDRPHDLRRTLDWLDEQAAGAYAGMIDPSRLAYAGHLGRRG